ncbi:MAG: tRNA (N(6)-L-threonylcarbamoyladenosine(37)-C(2))-methylthiotransferase MtaB [Bacteroidia bacterium]|nr:tRNA (N(6)-L-threonylcarbamoyladenosine(37)-C(2))-methylthiotransferase MtaB [Bacteroidia bacterium]
MLFTIFTLGCKVNTYESDATRELFLNEGWIEASPDDIPDIVLINTCTVTGMAAKKSRQHIRKFRNAYPKALVVVMGCYAQEEGQHVIDECGANLIVGTSHRGQIVSLIKNGLNYTRSQVALDENTRQFEYEEIATLFQPMTSRAFVKIQDGCDNFCSYCVIPYVRGRSRSRDPKNIIKEIKTLVENGFQEIVITGIHTGGYGKDLANYSLSTLIEDILREIPTLFRLRISSLEASEIDDHFISLLSKYPNIANHLHIPLQSGAESVLRRMNRRYHIDDYLATLDKIRLVRPDIAITTDIIVGFPGESDEEFSMTYAIAQLAAFSEIHVFPFSKRDNTAAAKMMGQVYSTIKKKRVDELLALSKTLHEQYANQFIGKTMDILFEDYDALNDAYRGHASNYLEVHLSSSENLAGRVVKIVYQGLKKSNIKTDFF